MRICSTRADIVGDPVPGESKVLATEESVWGQLLSLFMAQKGPEIWGLSLSEDRAKMSELKPLI